jgi:hypothetical protein
MLGCFTQLTIIYLFQYCFCLFVFVRHWVWTQGIALGRQTLYHLSLASYPFCSGSLEIGFFLSKEKVVILEDLKWQYANFNGYIMWDLKIPFLAFFNLQGMVAFICTLFFFQTWKKIITTFQQVTVHPFSICRNSDGDKVLLLSYDPWLGSWSPILSFSPSLA